MTLLEQATQPSSPDLQPALVYPRLRHCTFVADDNHAHLTMIVGNDFFQIAEEYGSRESFLRVKSYFDGRHSIEEISQLTGVSCTDIEAIVQSFDGLGLMRREEAVDRIPVENFLRRLEDSCLMWSRQIGYHRLFADLRQGHARREVFLGLLIETYHYVTSASKHIAVALAHSKDPLWGKLLAGYLEEEKDHGILLIKALENLGIPSDRVRDAHPIIGTMSLINMLCEIGRQDTLAYLACTSLFEARKDDFEPARQSFEEIAAVYGYDAQAVAPIIDHMRGDVLAGHKSLIREALAEATTLRAEEAHFIVNSLHDLKHSFDQFHDQIAQYYSDVSNYIPRLKVDYFSL